MEQTILATFREDDRVVAANVTVRLRITTRNGITRGEGRFIAPDEAFFDVGREYEMEATDGRKGRILTREVSSGSAKSTTVQFMCQGRFG